MTTKIVCDGCGKEMRCVGQIHEIIYDITARFPELCGYGKKIRVQPEKKPGVRKISRDGFAG